MAIKKILVLLMLLTVSASAQYVHREELVDTSAAIRGSVVGLSDSTLYTTRHYADSSLATKLNVSDSTIYVTPWQATWYADSLAALRVSYSDTASALVSSASKTGFLKYSDWSLFNSKQPAGTYLIPSDSTSLRNYSNLLYQPLENQRLSTANSPSFAGLTLTGALNAGSNTITSGLINGQTISSAASFTGTVTTADSLTVNGAGTSSFASKVEIASVRITGNQVSNWASSDLWLNYNTGQANNLLIGNGGTTPLMKVLNNGHVLIGTTTDDGVNLLQVNGGTAMAGNLTVNGTGTSSFAGKVSLASQHFSTLPPIYANNAAAITGGLVAGDVYRTGADPDVLCVVH